MSNHENEILKENIFDAWVEYLWLDGWDIHGPEIYIEAERRTESEWLEMN
jgi:hypothetical protein